MKSLAASALIVASTVAVAAQDPSASSQQQPPPQTFRSSVDLVPVDVNVIGRDGRPIADLTEQDFSLKVDGKARRITSAQFIGVTRGVERPAKEPDNFSSNPPSTGARLIMLVVDQGNIGAARGKYAIDAASRFIGRLTPDDRVGLVTIPGAGPQIDFTANRALVQTALKSVVGTSDDGEHQNNQIGLTEAIALQRGNRQVIQEIMDRECTGLTASPLTDCRAALEAQARSLYIDLKSRARDTVLSLRQVMERLARTSTPKTVVMVSEGILLDSRDLGEISWLGPLASRGQVTLYVLQLEPPAFNASNAQSSPTRAADIQFAHEGLGFLAGAARGSVFNVISGADSAFNRLTSELSGYYLLSFEPEAGDRDTKSHKIKIEVPGRKDVTVRARNEFSVDAPRVLTTEQQLADTIAAPLLATDIGLKLTSYSFTENDTNRLRVVLAAEIDRSQNPGRKLALGYTVVDSRDQIVSAQVEPEVTGGMRPETQTQVYLGAITASPGTYRIKLAVVDDAGKRGSVEHTIQARLTNAGQLHVTDLLLGEEGGAGGSLIPTVTANFSGDLLHGYLEVHSEAAEALKNATVEIEVASTADARAIESGAARMVDQPATPGRRAAEGVVPIALLPAGDYVARAVVTVAGQRVGQVSRPFRIVRSATSPTSAATTAGNVKPTIPFTSRTESFDRTSVLAPPVVGFFIDRMNIGRSGSPTPPAAVAAAREGKFDEASAAAKAGGSSQLAAVFFDGLAHYSRGDLEGAATRFRETIKLESEFLPAAFYLGACYAAGGKDRDATAAWQMSLITEAEAPFIYTLLGDGFIRLGEINAAIDILKEAAGLWPANDQVQLRLGTAYSRASRPVEAVQVLDPYLAQHPEDQERLFIALRSIYEARSTGQSIGTAEEDRKRFERYAAAYTAAGGTQTAMVEQWRKFVNR
jgi:VWFA-related protein